MIRWRILFCMRSEQIMFARPLELTTPTALGVTTSVGTVTTRYRTQPRLVNFQIFFFLLVCVCFCGRGSGGVGGGVHARTINSLNYYISPSENVLRLRLPYRCLGQFGSRLVPTTSFDLTNDPCTRIVRSVQT